MPPRVSVIIITYNHERYIAQAIESVLSQRTNFSYEILISEDFSTDTTRAIVEAYAKKLPHLIRLCLSDQNLNNNCVTTRAIEAANGEFIAILDGDDYISSPSKLQKQVEFLDVHQDCAMCYHNARVVDESGVPTGELHVKSSSPRLDGLGTILAANPVPGSSPMLRKTAVTTFPEWFVDAPFGDWPLYILAAQCGRIGYIDETLSVYRKHSASLWAGSSRQKQYDALMSWYDYLIRNLPSQYTSELISFQNFYRENDWYVTDIGDAFLALYESGWRFKDGHCTQHLKLHVKTLERMDGVRLSLSNPGFDPRFAGNRIEVSVGAASASHTACGPGKSFSLVLPCGVAAGETFVLSARSSLAWPRPENALGNDSRAIGFCLHTVTPMTSGE